VAGFQSYDGKTEKSVAQGIKSEAARHNMVRYGPVLGKPRTVNLGQNAAGLCRN